MFTDGVLVTLPVYEVVFDVLLVPVGDHGAQVVGRVVDMVLPSMVLLVGDGGQVRVLKVTPTCIPCSNVSQVIAPDLQEDHYRWEIVTDGLKFNNFEFMHSQKAYLVNRCTICLIFAARGLTLDLTALW